MNILSFNGGGIRGAILSIQLMLFYRNFGKIQYNMLAGTSTGSIICALLATGNSPAQIVTFYFKYGAEIFKKGWFPRILKRKYSDKNLNRLLQHYLGATTMIQDIETILVIPTTDTRTDSLKVWCSRGTYASELGFVLEQGENALLWEIVRASSSAPRYFSRYKINGVLYEDGGMKANNPSQIALNIGRAITNAPIHILSITTGRKQHAMKESEANDGIQVAGHVIDSVLDAVDQNTHHAVRHQVRAVDTYVRCESYLENSSGGVDDVSEKNMNAMQFDGITSFSRNIEKFQLFYEKTKATQN
jgi:patatin-like phospholipase/acyl hydrolase